MWLWVGAFAWTALWGLRLPGSSLRKQGRIRRTASLERHRSPTFAQPLIAVVMGPGVRRDGVVGFARAGVVPAKAGTHTPHRLFSEPRFADFRAATDSLGYSSRRSPGALQGSPRH